MLNSKRPTVVIFSQGDEVITGATVDTNATFLADHCRTLGFDIVRHITVADDMGELVQVLKDIDQMADICLCTGGLGPTQDDLTSEAFVTAFNTELVFDETSFTMMSEYFGKLNIEMAEVNRKQAFLPKNSTRIDNYWGTAAGFIAMGKRCRFYFMPGVPYEMKNMMEESVLGDLQSFFHIEKQNLITLRTMGMGESTIQQKVDQLALPDDIRISFRAGLPENELKLIFSKVYTDKLIRQYIAKVKDALGDSVYAIDGLDQSVKSLPDCVHQLMSNKERSISVIETISQGDIARQCHADWLKQSMVLPQMSDIMSLHDINSGELDESTVVDLANKEHAKNTSDITLMQLHKVSDDSRSIVLTAVVDDAKNSLSAYQEVTGRVHRKQVVSSALAFNLLRKFLLEN